MVRAQEQLLTVLDRLPAHKILSLGLVDGHNIWRTDLEKSLKHLKLAQRRLGNRLWIAPSCALLHSVVNRETQVALARMVEIAKLLQEGSPNLVSKINKKMRWLKGSNFFQG